MKPKVFLFLSTGRSGTQWIADTLASFYGDVAEVTHEPIDCAYHPRDFLRAYDTIDDMLAVDGVRDHLDHVERTIATRSYIETGWPVYGAIPLFIKRFGPGSVRIVRIARHPVDVAASFATHGFWHGRADEFATHGVIDPWAPRVAMPEYAERWKDMTSYEKCLYWWAELHLYGAELKDRFGDVPFLDVRFEELFAPGGSALDDLVAFLDLPPRVLSGALDRRVDEHRSAGASFDWWEIFDHPRIIAVSESLGYPVRWRNSADLRARYGIPRADRFLGGSRAMRWARARMRATANARRPRSGGSRRDEPGTAR